MVPRPPRLPSPSPALHALHLPAGLESPPSWGVEPPRLQDARPSPGVETPREASPPAAPQPEEGRTCLAPEPPTPPMLGEVPRRAPMNHLLDAGERRPGGVGGAWRGLEGLSPERCRAWARYLAHLAPHHSPPPDPPQGLTLTPTHTPTTSPDTPSPRAMDEGSPRPAPRPPWTKRRPSLTPDGLAPKALRPDHGDAAPLARLGVLGLDLSYRPRLDGPPIASRPTHAGVPGDADPSPCLETKITPTPPPRPSTPLHTSTHTPFPIFDFPSVSVGDFKGVGILKEAAMGDVAPLGKGLALSVLSFPWGTAGHYTPLRSTHRCPEPYPLLRKAVKEACEGNEGSDTRLIAVHHPRDSLHHALHHYHHHTHALPVMPDGGAEDEEIIDIETLDSPPPPPPPPTPPPAAHALQKPTEDAHRHALARPHASPTFPIDQNNRRSEFVSCEWLAVGCGRGGGRQGGARAGGQREGESAFSSQAECASLGRWVCCVALNRARAHAHARRRCRRPSRTHRSARGGWTVKEAACGVPCDPVSLLQEEEEEGG
ncbi:atrophin-1-like [Portunus trituberculatus]|uniref:atrophin-1-like n=1 Tax=Portunus trituberculatus TaxID=210409 RepID=UPI001E1CD05A|nr:atrophin-1-like [Portunus trituberculatus]